MDIEIRPPKKSRILQITIAASVILHAGLWAAATEMGTKPVSESYLASLVVTEPPEPTPAPTPAPTPKPTPPPKKDVPPPNTEKQVETKEPPKPIFGVTDESVVDDSSVSVRVGNTLMKAQEDEFTDPSKVKPYSGPKEPIKVSAPPKLLRMVPPEYPTLAKKSGREGRVVLKVHIGADGRVVSATVSRAEPPGMGFEQAALTAVKKWRYSPPSQGQDIWCYQPIRFQLDD
ncbi:MAG: TonB family protein [Deltaproteobacteria bacterium]|nr:TonB family protein [Deltaproteobacteria bacterium]